MKKFILSLLVILLFACQSPQNKKASLNENTDEASNNETINVQEPLNANQLISSLNTCYSSDNCKIALDNQLNNWLLEKKYISENSPVETDDQFSLELPKNVTKQNEDSVAKINLSPDYMNNQLIMGALNEWLTWKRPQLINTWQYYQYLKADMTEGLNKYNMTEPLILAIMSQESGGKVHSRSRAGAGGLFQIMPATAQRLGLSGKDGAYDMRFNPSKSAGAAAKYIHEQWQLYDGDKAKILAAYNSGENRFARLNKKYKNKSLWDKNFYYELPQETRHYIPVVLAAMLIFQDPDKFNVNLEPMDLDLIEIKLSHETSLSQLSICLGQEQRQLGWFRVIRNLNSGIKADKVIKKDTVLRIPKILQKTFESKCHEQELMTLAQSLHMADFKETQGMFKYKVKNGDSLNKIARKFRCTNRKEIARLNNLKAPKYLIRAGKYLKVPQC